jgi:predicted permease
LLESGLLAAAGSALGFGAAYAARGVLYSLLPRGVFPISLPIPINWRVLVVSLIAALVVTIACGLGPAFAAMRVSAPEALRVGARSVAGGRGRLRSAIVSGQLALCVLALVLAGMFMRGLRAASSIDVGFSDPAHVLLVDTDFGAARFTESRGVAALEELLMRLRGLPGIQSATVASMVPLGFGGRRIVEMSVEGYTPAPNDDMSAERAHVGPDYAATMKIAVLRGRDLRDDDRAGTELVALVNEAFVKRFLGNGDPIGRRINPGNGWTTIVGVLHDGKYDRLDEPLHPVVYVPTAQWFLPAMTIHVRTTIDAHALAEPVRRELALVHVDLPAVQARTLEEHIAASTFVPRTGSTVIGAFALIALVLSVVGLYGVLAFSVALRAREIAIRMALGAAERSIAWSVARHAASIVGLGALGGGVLASVCGPLLRARMSGVGSADPLIGAGAALIVVVATVIAVWVPARRAVRVDPAVALRGE